MLLVGCDNCLVTTNPDTSVGWIETKRLGINIDTYESYSTDAMFCSIECLINYFQNRNTSVNKKKR